MTYAINYDLCQSSIHQHRSMPLIKPLFQLRQPILDWDEFLVTPLCNSSSISKLDENVVFIDFNSSRRPVQSLFMQRQNLPLSAPRLSNVYRNPSWLLIGLFLFVSISAIFCSSPWPGYFVFYTSAPVYSLRVLTKGSHRNLGYILM